eukprot:m.26583 g.26583  ORF g.26583 m.26583 type:complete len:706 (+) comp29407_c0_seq9:18-2135(+)
MASVVVEGLCSSSKGRLSYDRDWNTSAKQIQETLKRLSDQPTLSSSAFQTDSWRWRESSEGIQLDSPRNDSRSSTSTEGELEQPLNRTRHAFPLTPIALEQKLQTSKVNASLRQHEKEGERRVNEKIERKKQLFENEMLKFHSQAKGNCEKNVEDYRLAEQMAYYEVTEHMDKMSVSYHQKRLTAEKLRQEKRRALHHLLKEGKAKGEEIAQEMIRKAEEARRRQEMISSLLSDSVSIRNTGIEAKQLLSNCQHKTHLDKSAEQVVSDLDQKREEAQQIAAQAQENDPTEPLMKRMEGLFMGTTSAFESVKELVKKASKDAQRAEEMKKQEETKAKQMEEEAQRKKEAEEKLKQEASAAAAATSADSQGGNLPDHLKGCVSASAFMLYTAFKKKQQDVAKACEPLTVPKDAQSKQQKYDLQKAVSHPVNAISPQSAAHLRDKVTRLSNLLKGVDVEIAGKRINARSHENGQLFCLDYVAKKLVLQGSQQVSSNHESAFALAAVVVGLWEEFPRLGELILAHFHATCPYTVPFYIPKYKDQSSTEYYKGLGYQVNDSDGTIESDDKYEKRMSGIIRLYAAIIQSSPARGEGKAHPYGLEHGWTWLAQLANLPPRPNITATILFDFLEVAGHCLLKKYKKQFQKLLSLICKELYPKIESVTPKDQQGPVIRLKLYLETCIKSGRIAEPKGYLSPTFWTRPASPLPYY